MKFLSAVLFFSLSLSVFAANSDDDVILPPIKSGKEVCLILLHGAVIKPDAYVPLAQQIQEQTPLSLWVGLPAANLNLGGWEKGIQRVIQDMTNQGMSTDQYFYAGHSEGGVDVQSYCFYNPQNCSGTILMAANLLRNGPGYSYDKGYPVPSLTIGGELDGLTRITRMMEAYYHQVFMSPTIAHAQKTSPVVVLEGLTHMQFASGSPPLAVHAQDLIPEISEEEAHQQIGQVAAEWLTQQVQNNVSVVLERYLKRTYTLLQPLLEAFQMESFYYFEQPCYEEFPDAKEDKSCCYQGGACQCGNRWSPTAQELMGALTGGRNLITLDAMHPVAQSPVHLPAINNSCDPGSKFCTLYTDTVTENIYHSSIALDIGTTPLAATEMRTKLKSRQAIQLAAGLVGIDFDESDGPSRCSQINQFTYDWALSRASVHSANRFKTLGQPLWFGADVLKSSGYAWINTPMTYTSTSIDGVAVIMVNATSLPTPVDFWQSASRGMHYCKLMSPAYAMEWIYVDGLRLHDSLASH